MTPDEEFEKALNSAADQHAKGASGLIDPPRWYAFIAGARFARAYVREHEAKDLADVLEHALELGYLGAGSTENWARQALKRYRGDI